MLITAYLITISSPMQARAVDANIYVDTDTTLAKDYMGLSVQWDPSDVWDYTPAQWKLLTDRVDFLRPSFIRCMISASYYSSNFEATGNPTYYWDSREMKRLYPILDYCQSHDIEVMFGEWWPPYGWQWDDPRWTRIIADCVEHLVKVKKYTCIRYYNKINEPHGTQPEYKIWKSAQRNLKDELIKRGLSPRIQVVGPDHSEGRDAMRWVGYIVKDGSGIIDTYETHWYATSDREIPNGEVETTFRDMRELVNTGDPNGKRKRFYVGEAGTGEWLNGMDSNRYIRDYEYGVYMSDYLAQTMRAGIAGVSAWMLEDAMHQQPRSYPPNGVPSGDPKVDYNFKVWGFWNSQGTGMGKPDDENLRPWFYTWSLLSRSFPRGSRIVYTTSPGIQGIRASAAVRQRGSKQDLSILVVNDSKTPRSFRLFVPNATGTITLKQYNYFDKNRPVNSHGFPVASKTLVNVRLASGQTVDLPSQGVVLFSSMDGGSPTTLTRGKPVPVTSISVQTENDTVQRGAAMQFTAKTDPPGHKVTWSVVPQGGAATISSIGLLTANKLGKVKIIASCPGSTIKSEMVVEVTKDHLLADPLDNWLKVFEHSENLTFENININLFENDPSRVKRRIDTVESFTYKFASAHDFAITIYHMNPRADMVKVFSSPDNITWREVEIKAAAPVTTQWDFKRSVLRPTNIPEGTKYLKIELGHDKEIFSPQIGMVKLSSGTIDN